MSEGPPPLDPRRVKALANETRVGILQLLDCRPASTSELALELHLPKNLVNYHLDVLIECDCIEIATTRERGGRGTRFYTAKPGVLLPVSQLDRREPITKAVMQAFVCKAESAMEAGAANDDATSTFAVETLWLTAPHRLSAIQALRLTVANLRGLHEQSRQLSIATDTPLIPLDVAIAMFEPLRSAE